MKVKMVHLLAAIWSCIKQRLETAAGLAFCHRVKTAAEFLRQFWSQQHHFTQQCRVIITAICQGRDVFTWHDQEMYGRGWIYVVKSDHVLIYIDQLGRNFPRRYLAKNTVIQNLSPTV